MAEPLQYKDTIIPECKIIKFQSFKDNRGFFREQFNSKVYEEVGLPTEYEQDNISWSYTGVLRGLHIQRENPQGKLVSCPEGRIIDVCVDIRPDSPSCGKYVITELGCDDAIYCPPGTLHGFLALENSMVYYKCTTRYHKESDSGVYAFDDSLKIPWPKMDQTYIMSEKDMNLETLEQFIKRYKWKSKD